MTAYCFFQPRFLLFPSPTFWGTHTHPSNLGSKQIKTSPGAAHIFLKAWRNLCAAPNKIDATSRPLPLFATPKLNAKRKHYWKTKWKEFIFCFSTCGGRSVGSEQRMALENRTGRPTQLIFISFCFLTVSFYFRPLATDGGGAENSSEKCPGNPETLGSFLFLLITAN